MKALVKMSAETHEPLADQSAINHWKNWSTMRMIIQKNEEKFRDQYGVIYEMGMVDVYRPGRQVTVFVNGRVELFVHMRTEDLMKNIEKFPEYQEEGMLSRKCGR